MRWVTTFLRILGTLMTSGKSFLDVVRRVALLVAVGLSLSLNWLNVPIGESWILSTKPVEITLGQLISGLLVVGFMFWQGGKSVEMTRLTMSSPKIKMMDVGLGQTQVWMISSDPILLTEKRLEQSVPIIKAYLMNEPNTSHDSARLKDASYEVSFVDEKDDSKLLTVTGKWPHNESPQAPLETGRSMVHLEKTDIGIGQKFQFDIAFKYKDGTDCYAWSVSSFSQEGIRNGFRIPRLQLRSRHIKAKVRLFGVGLTNPYQSWTIRFLNKGRGHDLEVLSWKEDHWIDSFMRPNRQRLFQWRQPAS